MPDALTKGGLRAIATGSKNFVRAVGGEIEANKQHVAAKDLYNVTGSFKASNPIDYKPVISAFGDIFVHYNLQFVYLLDSKKLGFHPNKAMYKLALDSVIKVFHGFKQVLENNEEPPVNFSKKFVIECFLKGNSKGGVFDKVRSKLPKIMFGKFLGGKLTHDDSKNNISTQELFEMPLVKAKDNYIYGSCSKSSDDPKKLLYRHIFDHEEGFKDPVTCIKYGST